MTDTRPAPIRSVEELTEQAGDWRLLAKLLEAPRDDWRRQLIELSADTIDPELDVAVKTAQREGNEYYHDCLFGTHGLLTSRESKYRFERDRGAVIADLHGLSEALGYSRIGPEPADHIVAHDDTITGSIGVIWSIMNWRELMEEKVGVRWDNIKSAEMKDIGSPNRDMTIQERALIQTYVDDAYNKFVGLVVEGRAGKGRVPVTDASVRALQSTILTGRRALEKGFVDELGFREHAVANLRQRAGIERADIVEYRPAKTFFEELIKIEGPLTPLDRLTKRIELLHTNGSPLLALWER